MIIFEQRIEQEPLIGALFFDIEPLTAIGTGKTALMPVIPVLIPVAATPMAGLFWPFLTRKKSLSAEISCRPENIRRLFVIIAPGFEQPIHQNVIGRPYTSKQPQSQLWAALQVLKGPHKPPNNLNLNYGRPCKP